MAATAGGRITKAIRDGVSSPAHIWMLAWPVLGENLLVMLVGWSDTILTGQFLKEDEYLAAITVASYLLWLLESCAAVVSIGCQAIVARLIGAGDDREANEVVLQSLLLAAGVGAIVSLLVWVFADRLLSFLLTGAAHAHAVFYLRRVAWSCPAMFLMLVGAMALRAAGHTMAGMWIIATINIVNIALAWLLTVGAGPVPAWGWAGIATGTMISFFVGGALAVGWLFVGYAELRLPRRKPRLDTVRFRRILRIGVPAAVNNVAVVFCQLWYIAIIGHLGDAAIAAHGVAIRCESISWLCADALAVATATLVGQSLGAGRPELARRYAWTAFRSGLVALCWMGVVFYTGAAWLFAIFVGAADSEVLRLGVPVLRLVALGMPGLAATIILTGALRGAGDTRWPLLYNLAGFLGVRIPLAYALTGSLWSLGLFGAWIAMVADLTARGLAALTRFLSENWTRTRV